MGESATNNVYSFNRNRDPLVEAIEKVEAADNLAYYAHPDELYELAQMQPGEELLVAIRFQREKGFPVYFCKRLNTVTTSEPEVFARSGAFGVDDEYLREHYGEKSALAKAFKQQPRVFALKDNVAREITDFL